MKIAIVHEWLVTYAGSEKALEKILELFPSADLFCVVDYLPDSQRDFLKGRKITTTFIQGLPFVRKKYRNYLPLLPLAISRLDLSGYDLVISSNHAVANGVKTNANQLHVSYTYSPMRYAWDLREQYLKEANLNKGFKGVIVRGLLSYLKKWDYKVAQKVDYFIGISEFIKNRIYNSYGKNSVVIYPPVDTDFFHINEEGHQEKDFYLAASRMVPYKMIPLIVSAFTKMPDKKLIVIGDGPEFERVKNCAGDNVKVLGYQNDLVLREHLQNARALVFAAEEDFGILPVEAQACGTPVIAFSKGGARETVNDLTHNKPTGVFFNEQTIDSIKLALDLFEKNKEKITRSNCRKNALRFSGDVFKAEFMRYMKEVEPKIQDHCL